MTLCNLLTAGAGLGLLAPWVACGPPRPVPTVERGRRIDRAVLEGFQRGVTTLQEAQERLGPPTRTVADPDGDTTCVWDYFHSDGKGSTAITAILKFGSDGLLQLRMVNQSSQKH
jgi:hypothetical protein